MAMQDGCFALFRALGDETRLKIFGMLSLQEVCACELLRHLEISQPTLSHHMKVLVGGGLVKGRKDGQWMRYTVDEQAVGQMMAFLEARRAEAGTLPDSCCGKEG